MAKTHPANTSSPLSAREGDVSAVRVADTAYTHDNADDYDVKRTMAPYSRRIHNFERDILLWALSHTAKESRILEIGCGTGRLMVEALNAGYRIDGIDGSGPMLEKLKSKLSAEHPQIDLTLADAANVPHEDGSYDMVYAVRLLNQTESAEYALTIVDEMIRLTKPGGYVLVEFVNRFRPRIGPARRKTVRLRPADVAQRGARAQSTVVAYRGAFLIGMHVYRCVPAFLLGLVGGVDRLLSGLLPRLCSRSYVLLRTVEQRA